MWYEEFTDKVSWSFECAVKDKNAESLELIKTSLINRNCASIYLDSCLSFCIQSLFFFSFCSLSFHSGLPSAFRRPCYIHYYLCKVPSISYFFTSYSPLANKFGWNNRKKTSSKPIKEKYQGKRKPWQRLLLSACLYS